MSERAAFKHCVRPIGPVQIHVFFILNQDTKTASGFILTRDLKYIFEKRVYQRVTEQKDKYVPRYWLKDLCNFARSELKDNETQKVPSKVMFIELSSLKTISEREQMNVEAVELFLQSFEHIDDYTLIPYNDSSIIQKPKKRKRVDRNLVLDKLGEKVESVMMEKFPVMLDNIYKKEAINRLISDPNTQRRALDELKTDPVIREKALETIQAEFRAKLNQRFVQWAQELCHK